MRKGVRFTLTSTSFPISLALRGPTGKLVVRRPRGEDGASTFVDYRAPRSGTYDAAVSLASGSDIGHRIAAKPG